jgi:hypothetical protein
VDFEISWRTPGCWGYHTDWLLSWSTGAGTHARHWQLTILGLQFCIRKHDLEKYLEDAL